MAESLPEMPEGRANVNQVAEGTASIEFRGWREAAWGWALNF